MPKRLFNLCYFSNNAGRTNMIKDSVNTDMANSLSLTYLKSIQSLTVVINQLSKALYVLYNKRLTVAEKAIQEELALCAELESFFLYTLMAALKKSAIS